MLEETELPAGSDHTVSFVERPPRLGDRAQGKRDDRGVEDTVGERDVVGVSPLEEQGNGRIADPSCEPLHHMSIGFEGVDLICRRRVEGHVESRSCADLDDPSGESVHQPSALIVHAHTLGWSEHGVVDLGDQGLVHTSDRSREPSRRGETWEFH